MIMSRLISAVVGVYAGIYICQNYEIPNLPGPIQLWDLISKRAKEFEKKDK